MVFLTNEHFTILNVKISFELSRKHHYIKKKQKSILFHHQKWKLNSCETISQSSYLQTSLWSSYSKAKYLVNCSSSLQLFALNLNKSTIRTYRKWSRNLTSYISNIAKVCGSGWFLFLAMPIMLSVEHFYDRSFIFVLAVPWMRMWMRSVNVIMIDKKMREKMKNSTHEKWISLKCSISYIMHNFQLIWYTEPDMEKE